MGAKFRNNSARKSNSGKNDCSRNTKRSDRKFNRTTNYINDSNADHYAEQNANGVGYKKNHLSWYYLNEPLAQQVGSVQWAERMGWPTLWNPSLKSSATNTPDTLGGRNLFNLPGFMILDYMPTLGVSEDAGSMLNIAGDAQSQAIWASLNRNYNATYTGADITCSNVAITSLYAYSCELARVLMLLNFYPSYAGYEAKDIVEALGYDYDDLVENLQPLISQFNKRMNSCAYFKVPANNTMAARWKFLFLQIFKDDPDLNKAQLYIPRHDSVLKWHPAPTAGAGSSLEAYKVALWPNSKLRAVEFFVHWDELYNAIKNDADVNAINRDMITYAEKNNVELLQFFTLPVVLPTIEPSLDMVFLNQLMNTPICGEIHSAGVLQATPNVLVSKPVVYDDHYWINMPDGYTIQTALNWATDYRALNHVFRCMDGQRTWQAAVHYLVDTPTFELASVEMVKDSWEGETSEQRTLYRCVYNVTSCGSEILTRARVFYKARVMGGAIKLLSQRVDSVLSICSYGSNNQHMNDVSLFREPSKMGCMTNTALRAFHFTPYVLTTAVEWHANSAAHTDITVGLYATMPVGDVGDYTLVSPRQLRELHEVANQRQVWFGPVLVQMEQTVIPRK